MKKLKCWEIFDCGKKRCPVYESKETNCWLMSNNYCREEIQGRFFKKMEMCLGCKVLKKNMDLQAMKETVKVLNKQIRQFSRTVRARDRELAGMNRELAKGLSEVFEALKKISSGEPGVRIPESSKIELIKKLKHIVNKTAKDVGEIIDQSHEFAIGLAEHFDVLHKVSRGDLKARVSGSSNVKLLGSLKKVTNEMIDNISREIAERKETESNYHEIFNAANDAIFIHDIETGDIIDVNQKMCEMFGCTRDEVLRLHVGALSAGVLPRNQKEAIQWVTKADNVGPQIFELLAQDKSGRFFWVEVSLKRASIGGKTRLLAVVRDISRRKKTERQLRQKEEREAIILSSLPMAFYTAQACDGYAWIWVSEQIKRITGFMPDEYIKNPHFWSSRIHPGDREKVINEFKSIVKKGIIVTEYRWQCADSSYNWFRDQAVLTRNEQDEPCEIVGTLMDITERKRTEEALRTLSLADELTGLYNRRGFFNIAEQQLKIARRMNKKILLLFADLDGLKWINDNLGHNEGDLALIEVSDILKKTFRESDFIARIGGDEFAVLAMETEEINVDIIAARLLENLNEHNLKRGRRYDLSISIGISCYDPEHPCSIDELLSRADKLMYEQKQKKREISTQGVPSEIKLLKS